MMNLEMIKAPYGGLWVIADGAPVRIFTIEIRGDEDDRHVWASRSSEAVGELEDFGEIGALVADMAKHVKESRTLSIGEKVGLLGNRLTLLKKNPPKGWSGAALGMMAASKPIRMNDMNRMMQPDIANPNAKCYEPALALALRFMLLVPAAVGTGTPSASAQVQISPAELGFSGDIATLTSSVQGTAPNEQDAWWGHVPELISGVTDKLIIGHKALILMKVKEAKDADDETLLPPDKFPKIKEDDYKDIANHGWKKLIKLPSTPELAAIIARGEAAWKADAGLHTHTHNKWKAAHNVTVKKQAEAAVRKARRELLSAAIGGGGGTGAGAPP